MLYESVSQECGAFRRCLPRNVRGKSVEALSKLREKGLSLVYVGCESGSDTVLYAVGKGETFESHWMH